MNDERDGHREAQDGGRVLAMMTDCAARIADLTAELANCKAHYDTEIEHGNHLTAERDAVVAQNAALVEIAERQVHAVEVNMGRGPEVFWRCDVCWAHKRPGSEEEQHSTDCALATNGAAGRALLEEVAALRRVEADVVKALRACVFCREGHCRADAHDWLKAHLSPEALAAVPSCQR